MVRLQRSSRSLNQFAPSETKSQMMQLRRRPRSWDGQHSGLWRRQDRRLSRGQDGLHPRLLSEGPQTGMWKIAICWTKVNLSLVICRKEKFKMIVKMIYEGTWSDWKINKVSNILLHSCDSLAESHSAPAKAQRHEQVLLVGHSKQSNNHCQKTAKLQPDNVKQEEEASREAIAVLHFTRG